MEAPQRPEAGKSLEMGFSISSDVAQQQSSGEADKVEERAVSWSPQQDGALKDVSAWFADPAGAQVFKLFGYAGTGKTTLAKQIADDAGGDVLFGSFTGKAALVLRSKGCWNARTIHSMIYKVEEGKLGEPVFALNRESDVTTADLIIIDEVSMVGADLAQDLLSFGRKVLVLGDPAQLPPVQDAGYFTEGEPDVMLTEVHRQARDNPIIRMSMTVREGGRLEHGAYGESRVVRAGEDRDGLQREVLNGQVLVGRNVTRQNYNKRIRALLGREGEPKAGDRLVCLKNNKEKGLLNGGLWSALSVKRRAKRGGKKDLFTPKAPIFDIEIDPEDAGSVAPADPIKASVIENFFNGTERQLTWRERKNFDEFDFGYALTTHKAQGSQWPNVVIFDESWCFRDDRQRWLYTAITRAAEKVTVVA